MGDVIKLPKLIKVWIPPHARGRVTEKNLHAYLCIKTPNALRFKLHDFTETKKAPKGKR